MSEEKPGRLHHGLRERILGLRITLWTLIVPPGCPQDVPVLLLWVSVSCAKLGAFPPARFPVASRGRWWRWRSSSPPARSPGSSRARRATIRRTGSRPISTGFTPGDGDAAPRRAELRRGDLRRRPALRIV
ncbi:hypothetical protein AB5I41_24640 [Sphingomonas sp. MMS24-JH45]